MLTDYSDVLNVIAPASAGGTAALLLGSNQMESDIIKKLNEGLRDGEATLRELKANPTEYATALSMLELSGTIRALGANH